MDTILISNLAIFMPMISIMYILYNKGYATTDCMISLLFYSKFKNIKYSLGANFAYARGFTRRVVKFDKSKQYNFNLEYLVNEGNLVIEILDKYKNIIGTLNKENTNLSLLVNEKEKYYIKARFFKCSGSYCLNWT